MKNILIARTVLSLIPMIDDVCNSILVENHNLARNSMTHMNTYEITQRILENIDCSDELHNLKVLTLEWLENLSERSQFLVKYHYFKGFTVEQISDVFGVSIRTVFRLLDSITEDFAHYLNNIEDDYFNFNRLVRRNDWIRDEYWKQF